MGKKRTKSIIKFSKYLLWKLFKKWVKFKNIKIEIDIKKKANKNIPPSEIIS